MLLTLLLACQPVSLDPLPVDSEPPDDSDAPVLGEGVYDIDRLMEVAIELDEQDWAEIREQERDILWSLTRESCMTEPFDSPYTWVEGTIEIDGERYEEVGVRKKGLLGSVVSDRPSLKVRFDKYREDQLFEGLTRLTFNNGRQDFSRIKTCMGYELLAELGVGASRCSFAHLTVNGEDLGVYANVEPVHLEMLSRLYGDATGARYEGTLSDFREGWTATFDVKDDSGDRSEIQAIQEVLERAPADLVGELDEVMDVAQFIRFWSAEGLLGHWDGYAGNTNNFYLYVSPEDGRVRFIPWGIDAILVGSTPFGQGAPAAVALRGALAQALYGDSEGRALYWAQMQEHLAVWDSGALEERVDTFGELVADARFPGVDLARVEQELDAIRAFVRTRPEVVQAEIDDPPIVDLAPRAWPCLGDVGSFDLSFETTWGSYGTLPTWSTGTGSLSLSLSGVDYPVTFLSAVAGEYAEGESVLLVAGQAEGGANVAFYALGPTASMTTVGTAQADFIDLTAYLLLDSDGDLQDWQTYAYVGGPVELQEAGSSQGATLRGSAQLTVFGAVEQ